MVKGFVFLFCFCMAWTGVAFSQQRYSIYQSMNTSSGLPSNYVFASAEDENGFLWIGTDKGLFRYDGFRWQVWDRDNGLPGNYINTVLSDKRGGLWLGVSEKGFYHFDPSTNTVREIAFKALPLQHSVQTDEEGNLFAEVLFGNTHKAYLLHPGRLQNPELIFESSVPGVLLKGDAKTKKVFCLSAEQPKLLQAKESLRAKWPLKLLRTDKMLFTRPVYYVSDSVILTSTHYYRFDTEGRILAEEQLFEPGNSYAFSCAATDGLYVYNVKTGYFFFDREGKKTFYDKSSGLGTDHVNHIFQARDRTIIISTLGAGVQFIKNNYRKTYYTNNNTVRSIVPSGADWYVLNGDNIYKTKGNGSGLSLLGAVAPSNLNLFVAGDTLMVGTLKGINFYKEQGASIKPAGFLEFTAGISSIIRQNGHMVAGTYGGGLLHFQSSRILQRDHDYPFRIVERLVPLPIGFAALSYEDGLQLTASAGKHVHLTQKNGLLSNSVYTLYERNDSLWIGTKGGIVVYEKRRVAQAFRFPTHASQERPLICFHDAMNKLWVVSNTRLYEAKDGRLMPLSSYPLVGENDIVTAASYNKATNELAIGSDKTFSIISLNNIHADTLVQSPRLTSIVLDNATIADPSFTIPYHFNAVRFSLSASSALPFSRNRVYYQLRGLSNEWKEVKDSLMISFTGLRPGTYSLWVKTVNADGYESRMVQLAAFSVEKPFWQSWLFIGACMLLMMVATIFAVRQLGKKERRRKEAGLVLRQSLQRERERIAKDLHDHLGTNLVTMVAQADHIEHRLHKGDLQTASVTLQHLSEQTRATMNVLRETVWAVQETEHSLGEFILRIRSFLQRLFETTQIEWTVDSGIEKEILLSPAQTLHLFRIVQEASQNIVKHAGASRAHYSFSLQANQLVLVIEDNGKGFTRPAGSTNGLTNIEERVQELLGTAIIKTEPSVHIQIQIPIQIR
jgi:signal transduction histidine kinase